MIVLVTADDALAQAGPSCKRLPQLEYGYIAIMAVMAMVQECMQNRHGAATETVTSISLAEWGNAAVFTFRRVKQPAARCVGKSA